MLTCYERCLYLLYSQICTYCMKIFIFAPYRRVYSSSSVDYICVHVCPTQEGSFQHLCGLHLWPGRHGPALCPLPTAGVCPLKPLRPGLPHWRLPVCQGRAADGRELQAAHLSAFLQHLPSGTFSQSMAGMRLWLLLCVVQCWVVMNWFVGKLSW